MTTDEGTTSGTSGDSETTGSSGETADEPLCVPGEESSCYPGREGSAGVGLCKEGAQICADDGESYEECIGAVVPSTELCESRGDENCDGFIGCDGAVQWNLGYRGHEHSFPNASDHAALAVDALGDVWIAQSFIKELEFEGVKLSTSHSNTMLAKLSPSGKVHWVRTIGSDEQSSGLTVKRLVARPGGGVAVTAEFLGSEPEFAGTALPTTFWGTPGLLIGALTADGAAAWVVADRGEEYADQAIRGIATDSLGNITVAGNLDGGTLDFGGGPLSPLPEYGSSGFLVSLSAQGEYRWGRMLHGSDSLHDVAIADGALWVGGEVRSYRKVDLGAGDEALDQDYLITSYLARFDRETGDYLGVTKIPANFADLPLVVAQPAGGAILAMDFSSELRLGDEIITHVGGGPDVLVTGIDALGVPQWYHVIRGGGWGVGRIFSAASDGHGSAVVAGYTRNMGLDFGDGELPDGPRGILTFKWRFRMWGGP